MKIVDVAIHACTQRLRDANWKFSRAAVAGLEGHVLILTDEAGNTGVGYAHAIAAISGNGAGVLAGLSMLAPLLHGRSTHELGAIVDECERMLAFHVTGKAAIDMALHDLLARQLGVPVHVLLGGRRRDTIVQSRIVPIKDAAEMGQRAATLAQQGYQQLKLKLSGDTSMDVARIATVRDAVGPHVALTLDPNQSYSAKQMMSAFSQMERFDIALIEQPVPASDWEGLKLLTRSLPVAIEADESAQSVQDVYRLVTDRTVDVVNLKITKLGGLARFMEAVRICEAGGVACRVGAAFGPSALQAFAAHAASTIRALPYACELSEHQHLLDDPFEPLAVDAGVVNVPTSPGSGIAYLGPAERA